MTAVYPMDSPLPSSRLSASDTHLPAHGPIPLFDAHLRFLTDSYLSFFNERKRIEESYVDSLMRLHRKIKSIDSFLDDRTDLSNSRVAWAEIRDNVEREAQARQAFLSTLTVDVLNPLTTVKETQERTRKRIKEDLKESGSAYNEYAEVTLPKLKTKYIKKFAEVEESKKAALSPPTSPQSPPSDAHHITASMKPNHLGTARPTVTSPQPLRAIDRRPSGSAPGRNRSPSSGTAFSDLAHQGKRQLNTLIGFLDKSGTVKDSLGGKENHALRVVRTKRELEEADKEYRKGVHWLETLRLRRTKTLESGYNSLSTFVEESSAAVKKALEKYTDNMIATTTTQTQLSTHARSAVDRISPEKDVARVTAYIPRSLASAIPEPVLYQHGLVGECKDLIFGFSLVGYATSKNLSDGDIPKIVKMCVAEIDSRGSEAEGIYRVSGRHAVVQSLQRDIEKDESAFEFKQHHDIYAVASLLKASIAKSKTLYLRELPEPVFRFSLQDRIHHSEELAEHQSNNFMLLRSKMRRLPAVHQATLKAIVEHLARIVAMSDRNKMDAKNVAIVFGSVIFGEDEIPKGVDLLTVQTWKVSVLFDEQGAHHSPPLPPTPLGEPMPQYSYGSRLTKFAPPSSLSPTADFTPPLPPRPTGSIHPSLRAGQSSPTKDRLEIPPMPQRADSTNYTDEANIAVTVPSSPSITSTVYITDESADELESSPSSPGRPKSVKSEQVRAGTPSDDSISGDAPVT
ncbi:hypothetical protein IW261DRAFT_1505427 [Armillaria novae-zelandiae]|uniref:Rho-GAP domain-containing protein n=1 Tax=Armillaria novae-zelandiae TaxID=153914 RepID=A0AA39NWT1_9AGAR|nr:hypothetical protein IW261DRAFT_1505427 [Armillaria novae-zelandiae]